MDSAAIKRNTWVACPNCGHKMAKVRMCDMELKCKHCGHEFEAIIGAPRVLMVREEAKPYQAGENKESRSSNAS